MLKIKSALISVFDKNGEDSLWVRVYYNEFEKNDIDKSLKKIYNIRKSVRH